MDDRRRSSSAAGREPGGLRSLSASAIEGVRSLEQEIDRVIDAIEGLAGGPGGDAAARTLSQLADTLAGYAARLRHEWQELDEMLARAARHVQPDGAPSERPRPKSAGSRARASAEKRAGSSGRSGRGGKRKTGDTDSASEGLRVLVTQMAASGVSRREIERRLRVDYGVKRARALVAEILTP